MTRSAVARRIASVFVGGLALLGGAATAELTLAAPRPAAPLVDTTRGVVEGIAPLGSSPDVGNGDAPTSVTPTALAPTTLGPSRGAENATIGEPLDERQAPLRSLDAAASNLRGGRIITGATDHRLILFTFDDGPDPRYTRRLLDALDETGIHAVFFLTTRRFAGSTPYERNLASIAREVAERGHHVGTHTMDHIQLPLVSNQDLLAQVDESARLVAREVGSAPSLLRPPGGSRSPRIDAFLTQRGYTQVLWNLGTGDVQVRTADAVLATFRRVLEVRERDHGERGGVVLLHDIHAWSVEAFPRIVAYLDRRNCDFLDADEELYDFVDDPALFFEARREGDTNDAVAQVELPSDVLAVRQVRARARAEARCQDRDHLDAIVTGRVSSPRRANR